jgi:hypothetical protein
VAVSVRATLPLIRTVALFGPEGWAVMPRIQIADLDVTVGLEGGAQHIAGGADLADAPPCSTYFAQPASLSLPPLPGLPMPLALPSPSLSPIVPPSTTSWIGLGGVAYYVFPTAPALKK